VDRAIPQVSQFMINHGMDPLNLPQIDKKLWMVCNAQFIT